MFTRSYILSYLDLAYFLDAATSFKVLLINIFAYITVIINIETEQFGKRAPKCSSLQTKQPFLPTYY